MNAESAWPQSLQDSLQEEEEGHKWPKLKIISGPKAENKKKTAQICCLLKMQLLERVTAWYLVTRLLQHFINEAQDETWVGVTWQAIRKKNLDIRFKDYGLTYLQALHQSFKVQCETFRRKKMVFLTLLTFYTLHGFLDTKYN